MIDEFELIQMFRIDKKRLNSYYERIENQFHNFTLNQIIATFLNGQSIGTSMYDVIIVLNYYKNLIIDNRTLLDFAFEWIRAKQIRFHYIKYLANAQFLNYETAIDACIFLFFQKYDLLLRNLFMRKVKEYEISSLYRVFFNPMETKFNFNKILEEKKNQVPIIIQSLEEFNPIIYTLRSGLSEIIRYDFEKIINNR